MATEIKPDSSFDHFSQAAPEYVEVVLWRRVIVVVGALLAALLIVGWLVLHWLSGNPKQNTAEVQPNLLAPPSAIPTAITPKAESTPADDATKAAADTASTNSPDASVSKPAATITTAPDASTKAAPSATVATPTTPTSSVPNTENTTAPVSADSTAKEKPNSEASPATVADRYTVTTEIFMPTVKRFVLTRHIRHREPTSALTDTQDLKGLDKFSLYQFMEVQGQKGITLHYIWKRNGKVVAKVRVPVRGDKWRSYSSKNFNTRLLGNWEVDVVDNKNRLMARSRFYLGS